MEDEDDSYFWVLQVQALDKFDTSGRSAANILAERLEGGVACEGDLHTLMLRGACMSSRGQLRGEKSAAEVIAKVGCRNFLAFPPGYHPLLRLRAMHSPSPGTNNYPPSSSYSV